MVPSKSPGPFVLQWSHLLPGGCYRRFCSIRRRTSSFNGATCCQVDATPQRPVCIPRADASMEPPAARWMLPHSARMPSSTVVLQWSHLLPGGCYPHLPSPTPPVAASMEPPVARWMLRTCRSTRSRPSKRFNGATCCQVDVAPLLDLHHCDILASMEPPVARWMLPARRQYCARGSALQWSHLLPGGCYAHSNRVAVRIDASMEPPVARWMLQAV